MEHRCYPRKQVQLNADLIGSDGKKYPVWVHDISAIGMRVATHERLPERIKSVDIQLYIPDEHGDLYRPVRMYVTYRNGRDIGLCLTNENMRFSLESMLAEPDGYTSIRKYAAS